ncbi:hypothetical protein C8J56DRAFT_891488 [Mycena floridula]|nr:hypothetical protein C8J56DRAFT_891488 [Mycena floridula]
MVTWARLLGESNFVVCPRSGSELIEPGLNTNLNRRFGHVQTMLRSSEPGSDLNLFICGAEAGQPRNEIFFGVFPMIQSPPEAVLTTQLGDIWRFAALFSSNRFKPEPNLDRTGPRTDYSCRWRLHIDDVFVAETQVVLALPRVRSRSEIARQPVPGLRNHEKMILAAETAVKWLNQGIENQVELGNIGNRVPAAPQAGVNLTQSRGRGLRSDEQRNPAETA